MNFHNVLQWSSSFVSQKDQFRKCFVSMLIIYSDNQGSNGKFFCLPSFWHESHPPQNSGEVSQNCSCWSSLYISLSHHDWHCPAHKKHKDMCVCVCDLVMRIIQIFVHESYVRKRLKWCSMGRHNSHLPWCNRHDILRNNVLRIACMTTFPTTCAFDRRKKE